MSRATTLLVLTVISALAHGDEIPHRKAGLWQLVTQPSAPQAKPMTHRFCLDHDTEALLDRLSSGSWQQDCSKHELHVSGGKLMLHTVCGLMGSQQTSDAIVTFNGDSSYTAQSQSHYDPPLMGRTETHTTQEGKWLSACPAGMKPGDMVMTDSRGRESHVNLRTLLQTTK